jgi:hypothetical protein
MKKLMSLLVVLAMVCSLVPAALADSSPSSQYGPLDPSVTTSDGVKVETTYDHYTYIDDQGREVTVDVKTVTTTKDGQLISQVITTQAARDDDTVVIKTENTDANGNATQTVDARVGSKDAADGECTFPKEAVVVATQDGASAPVINVTTPAPVDVTAPVSNANPGTVVSANGQPVSGATATNGSVTFPVGKDASVKVTGGLYFIDVGGHWAESNIYYVANRGVFAGTSANTFSPELPMTRAMVWTILARLDNPDIPSTGANWYAAAREWAMANGISDGTNPMNNVTREQFAAMLYRYSQLKGKDVSVGEDTNILSYDDAFSVSEWAMPAMQWACGAGLINGIGSNLVPQGNATRAQVATIMARYLVG